MGPRKSRFPQNLTDIRTYIRTDISNYRVASLLETRMATSIIARLNKSEGQINFDKYRVTALMILKKENVILQSEQNKYVVE